MLAATGVHDGAGIHEMHIGGVFGILGHLLVTEEVLSVGDDPRVRVLVPAPACPTDEGFGPVALHELLDHVHLPLRREHPPNGRVQVLRAHQFHLIADQIVVAVEACALHQRH